MLSAATELAALELMLSGSTTVSDHHYVFSSDIEDAVDIQVASLTNLGVRAHLTRGSMSLGQSAGGLPPDDIVQTEDVILRDCERVVDKFHQAGEASIVADRLGALLSIFR